MATVSTEKGFTLFVEVTIQTGKVEEFLGFFQSMLRKITTEEGFLSLEVFRSEEKPNRLCWVENWSKSRSWFNENVLTKPYVQQYLAATELLCDGERNLRSWNRLGGNFAVANSGVYQKPYAEAA